MNFDALEKHHIALKSPLLLIKAAQGILGCGYFSIDAFNRGSEAAAIVRGVRTHEEMLKAKVTDVSEAARLLGVEPGMTGEEALEKFSR